MKDHDLVIHINRCLHITFILLSNRKPDPSSNFQNQGG